MTTGKRIFAAAVALLTLGRVDAERAAKDDSPESPPAAPATKDADQSTRADKRYDEMLGRMQAAVEEIAQLYGNPLFLQVFTNDAERASLLKQRLHSEGSGETMAKELKDLRDKRDDLINDIALKEREAARLSARLARQRGALDALAIAVEQARKVIEDTTK
jgi:hypothetical protein